MNRTRRQLLQTSVGGLAVLALPGPVAWAASARLPDDPFTLGIASGCPMSRAAAWATR
jgi:phosphodiesterase/alkaline phosphatase D-like protein